MKQILILIIILIFPNLCFADKADDSIYLRIVEDADNAIISRNYRKAEKLLLEAMHMQPGNPSNILLLSNLGMVRFYMGNDSLALQNLDDAHRMAPASVTVLLNRARVRSAIGQTENAINDYNLVCELDSAVADAYFYRGMIKMSEHKINEAYIDFKKLKSIDPDGFNTALALGIYYIEKNMPKEAIPYFTKLLETEKTSEYYSSRALCYLMCDQLSEASEDIASGLEIDPNDGELYLCRALLNKKRYRPADSTIDAKKAIELGINPKRIESLLY